MGQKVNPISFRTGIIRDWQSKWFFDNKKEYREFLLEDLKIRRFLEKKLKNASLALCEIERERDIIKINLYSSRPGVIIGRGGAGIEDLKKEVEEQVKRKVRIEINIQEVRNPEASAAIMARFLADQIEKRMPFRRASKKILEKIMEAAGVYGAKIKIAGRLDGSEIARSEGFSKGKLPLHTLRADVDFAKVEAHMTYGTIGIKIWIYKGEVFKERKVKK